MTDPTVVVQNLTRTFVDEGRGIVRAVNDVSFTCQAGEIFGLLGANGAGKTTTLRILATLLSPTSGSARLLQHDVSLHPEDVRRHLGFHTATTALYPHLTTRETLEFFARINGFPPERIRPRVDALISRFGLSDYAQARIAKLSQGMKQKVALARTVAHDPPVLIFDEPTVGLDILNALELRRIVTDLRAEGKTILYSTHIMAEAEKLCDRIAILHQGQLLACDSLQGLRTATSLHYLEDIFVKLITPRNPSP
jgi:sodium transport system ATP-binding protein